MSESLPVLVIVTSNDCSACRSLHRTGNFNRDPSPSGPSLATFFGSKWDDSFFQSLLTGNPDPGPRSKPAFRVFELELRSMDRSTINFADINPNEQQSRVTAFTEFMLDNSNKDKLSVIRHTYYNFTDQDTHTLDGTLYLKDDTKIEDGERINKSFHSMITSIFPIGLHNLFFQYPSFMWFSRLEWNKGLKDKKYIPFGAIFGLTMGEKEVDGKKIWAVTARDGDLGERKTPVLMGSYITSHPDILVGKPTPVIKAEPTPVKSESSITKSNSSKNASVCKPARVKIIPLVNTPGYYSYKR